MRDDRTMAVRELAIRHAMLRQVTSSTTPPTIRLHRCIARMSSLTHSRYLLSPCPRSRFFTPIAGYDSDGASGKYELANLFRRLNRESCKLRGSSKDVGFGSSEAEAEVSNRCIVTSDHQRHLWERS